MSQQNKLLKLCGCCFHRQNLVQIATIKHKMDLSTKKLQPCKHTPYSTAEIIYFLMYL